MYTELMQKLGFEDKEIAVFIAVLERGRVTPATVSTITGIKRPTVYNVAKTLADKGVLYIDATSEPTYLVVESGDLLENVIKKQELQLKEDRETVQQTMKLLENIPKSKNYSVPKVRFYNDKEFENALYEQIKVWYESALAIGEYTAHGFQDASWGNTFPEWLKYCWEICPEEVSAHYLMDIRDKKTNEKHNKFNPKRIIKYIESGTHTFTGSQIVIGDYILYVMTNEKPYYMIEIHDRVMAHNLREVFKMLWEKI
jgi:sugar-specific transcriptional regulator TrmB